MDYNNTVHLPQTDFPMRAGLPKREPEMLEGMEKRDLYRKMVKRNEGKPRFILHDGPPYANGNIHIGTAMNKTLKDIIVKSKNMMGFQAPYVPGWDTHGLPIETAVLKDKSVKREEMSTADFRTKCQEYAEGYIARMTEQFKRLGVLGEWENPYITLKPEFEAKQIEVFGKMAEKGLIYKGMKPVYWCPFDQTALAEAEIMPWKSRFERSDRRFPDPYNLFESYRTSRAFPPPIFGCYQSKHPANPSAGP